MTSFPDLRRMMVDTQVRPSDVTKFPIIEALLAVPREDFVPMSAKGSAYIGEHINLSDDRVILDPRVFAKMLEVVDVQPDDLVLDLGAGLGYSAAVLGRLAEAVIAVEEDEDCATEAGTLLSGVSDNVMVVKGSLNQGAPDHGPYDVVLIEGAVEEVPKSLLDQLTDGGRIVALFQEGHLGVVRVGYKLDGAVNWRFAFNASAPVLPGFEKLSEFSF